MGIIAALEHIDRQTDDFSVKLEGLISDLLSEMDSKNLHGKNLNGHDTVVKIEALVYRRLGLKIGIRTNSHLACILPYYSNRNHIFLSDMWRGNINLTDQTRLLHKQEGKSGTVNIHKAMLTGIFSEYENPVFMNFSVLAKTFNLSPGEITAIFLHELGHGFNACFYADRTDRINQVLQSIHQRTTNRQGEKDLEYVYREIEKISPSAKKEEIDKFLNGGRVVGGLVWFNIVVGMVRSLMQNDRYSDTAFEELSDSFAGRFGYAVPLTTALEKLHGASVETMPAIARMMYFIGLLEIVAFAAITGIALMNPASFIYGMFLIVWGIFNTYLSGEEYQDYTYDKLKDRYIRMRQDVIEQLKDKSIKPADVKKMLDGIYLIDEIVKKTSVYRNPLTQLSNMVFSDNRNALKSIEAQKLLESLASNDLFVASAEFRTLKD